MTTQPTNHPIAQDQTAIDDQNETRCVLLRTKALALLEEAHGIDGRLPYLMVHGHREGFTTAVVWSKGIPDEDRVVEALDLNYEPDREESIEFEQLMLDEVTGVAPSTQLADDDTDEALVQVDGGSSAEVPRG